MNKINDNIWSLLIILGAVLMLVDLKKAGAVAVMLALAVCFSKRENEEKRSYFIRVLTAALGEILVFCVAFVL